MSGELIPRKVDPNSRVVLPPDVLKALGIRPGDYVVFDIQQEGVTIYRAKISKA